MMTDRNPGVRIDFLCNHPQAAPILARWHHDEWKHLYRNWTVDSALHELASHGSERIPVTLIALKDDVVTGSVSLIEHDLEGFPNLSPWLANLYVRHDRRGLGLGKLLIGECLAHAEKLDLGRIYLFTTDMIDFYRDLGWAIETPSTVLGHDITIMSRPL